MKIIFYLALVLLLGFEIAAVYFIMPFPGSQRMHSIELAYFLYSYRWIIRTAIFLIIIFSFLKSSWRRKWLPLIPLTVITILILIINFKMQADKMFYQPSQLVMAPKEKNKVELERLVMGVSLNGISKAYPIQFLGYHHQVVDSLGGEKIMVTYCTVCRTGRIYRPVIDNKFETFRLVGMDHFNAMFEDKTTHSWWRQATGEAVAGSLKGKKLPEIFFRQVSLKDWLFDNPGSLIMQPDSEFTDEYAQMSNYETGGKGNLTGTDRNSWKPKSLVVGIAVGDNSRAFDWNELVQKRIINDTVGNTPVLIALKNDRKSLYAFKRPSENMLFSLSGDTLIAGNLKFNFNGNQLGNDSSIGNLIPISSYQEFWHSWNTFHPR